jgi:DNA polymerase III alpha subunit (gram-positive type)
MPQEKATRQVSNEDRFEPAMKELIEVARSLHQLMLSYGPLWYTAETDARLRKALARADSALTASEKGSPRPRSLEYHAA